ncbi:MAG: GNAT family N-acetyltransferase, partial [Rhodobacterales bacterium]
MDALPLPLPQSAEFARTCAALGLALQRHEQACDGQLSGVWQVQARRLPVRGQVDLISRGPVGRLPGGGAAWLRALPARQG